MKATTTSGRTRDGSAALTRRDLLLSVAGAAGAAAAAAAGVAAAAVAPRVLAQSTRAAGDDVNLAIIGTGDHGRHLISQAVSLPGARFRAVCDIWPFARNYAARMLGKYKHAVNAYEDYRELLAAEKDLDAVIIATPDGFHAEQTIACLAAGRHVYCEKEMALTVEDCRKAVLAARQAGKLLQVGRQHRSNDRYHMALDYIDNKKALGRITHVSGQWHGHKRMPLTWPASQAMDQATLARYGFESMDQLRNWRWFPRFAAGELASLGGHQIDVFNWFLHAPPKAAYASGGLDYYDKYELYDNVDCIYEWDYASDGRTTTVRGNYEIITTTEMGGFFETFTGVDGTLRISEIASRGGLWRERDVPVAEWEKRLTAVPSEPDARAFGPLSSPADARHAYYYHLQNFLDAIRGKCRLNCPAEVGFQTAVSVLRVKDAMKTGKRIEFRPEEFKV